MSIQEDRKPIDVDSWNDAIEMAMYMVHMYYPRPEEIILEQLRKLKRKKAK